MGTVEILVGIVLALVLLDVLALRHGAESRPGFAVLRRFPR